MALAADKGAGAATSALWLLMLVTAVVDKVLHGSKADAVAAVRDGVTACGGVAGGGTTQLSCGPIRVGGAALARHVRRPVGARAKGGAMEAVHPCLRTHATAPRAAKPHRHGLPFA